MAKKAKRKRTTSNDAQARAKQLSQGQWFWELRERWLSGHDDKSLVRAFEAGILPRRRSAAKPKPKSAKPKPKSKPSRQVDRVRLALKKLYPHEVPAEIPTETIRGQVAAELGPESERLGLGEPSWQTVNRALGRSK